MKKKHISVVVPVYGAANSLNELYTRLSSALSSLSNTYEIILVNDACPGGSWDIIQALSESDVHVKGINLSRNFGQHYAITAGLKESNADWVVVMDCDLQDQPEEIIKLYEKALQGFDIVFGKRLARQDSKLKKLASKFFYKVLSYLTGTVQDSSIANFGIYSKSSIEAVLSMGDCIRYFPVMIRWVGFNSAALEVEHSKRHEGSSSYSIPALFSLAIDVILSFSDKPLKIFVKGGGVISCLSFIVSLYVLFQVIIHDISVPGWASTVISLWFIGGIIIMVLGVVGIYVGKIFDQVKDRPRYIVSQRTWK